LTVVILLSAIDLSDVQFTNAPTSIVLTLVNKDSSLNEVISVLFLKVVPME